MLCLNQINAALVSRRDFFKICSWYKLYSRISTASHTSTFMPCVFLWCCSAMCETVECPTQTRRPWPLQQPHIHPSLALTLLCWSEVRRVTGDEAVVHCLLSGWRGMFIPRERLMQMKRSSNYNNRVNLSLTRWAVRGCSSGQRRSWRFVGYCGFCKKWDVGDSCSSCLLRCKSFFRCTVLG